MTRKTLLRTPLLAALLAASLLTTQLGAETLVLDGGTVHPISSEPFVGRVVIDGGKIVALGPQATAPAGSRHLDVEGLHVYPGMFDALGQIGMVEINAVSATVDTTEMGAYNPQLHATTAVHPASEVIPVTRAEGITQAVSAPNAGNEGVILGQAGLLHLSGWTVEEMAIQPSLAMIIAWPEIQTRSFDFATFSRRDVPFSEAEEKAETAQNELRDWMDAARQYEHAVAAGSKRLERDLKLEAMIPMIRGEEPVVIMANAARDIKAAVAFAEQYHLHMILGGGRDAWKVKTLLAEKNIPVILGSVQSLPEEEDDPYDRPFRTAGELAAAGITVAFGSGAGGGFGPGGPHAARTLPLEAGMATAYGLSEQEALRTLTLNPARIFGVDGQLGSIEVGKIANLVVTDASPLGIATQVRHVIIAGREVSTDNKHRALYERYRARP